MNSDVFVVSAGKKVQDISGSIAVDTTGLATEAKQDAIVTAIQAIPGGGGIQYTEADTDATITGTALMWEDTADTLRVASAAKPLPVDLKNTSVAVTGTFWQATQPVSGTVTATATDLDIRNLAKAQDEVYSVLRTDAGAAYDARQVTVQNSSIPVTDNAGSLTVDAPVATPVFVRLSDGAAAISTLPVSLASVPSHAVTNAGTFAVQSTNQANSGVDIGDVTINNAAGAAAVNIQDGGNTITVDGTVAATQSGTWTVQPGNTANTTAWLTSSRPATTGGLSKFHLVGAATTNLTNIKASAGQVYAITAFNVSATPIYIKFHNTAGSPTAGSGVTDTFLVPGNTAGSGVVINIDNGIAFSTGIAISTVTGIADADTTAIAASSLVMNIYYS